VDFFRPVDFLAVDFLAVDFRLLGALAVTVGVMGGVGSNPAPVPGGSSPVRTVVSVSARPGIGSVTPAAASRALSSNPRSSVIQDLLTA
jgi:hypothetical protein